MIIFSYAKKQIKTAQAIKLNWSKQSHKICQIKLFQYDPKNTEKINYNNNCKNKKDRNKQTNNYYNKKSNTENKISNKENIFNSPDSIKKDAKKQTLNKTKEIFTQKFLNFFAKKIFLWN